MSKRQYARKGKLIIQFKIIGCTNVRPGLDHIFIWLGPAPLPPPLVPGSTARTCVGTPPLWEPM